MRYVLWDEIMLFEDYLLTLIVLDTSSSQAPNLGVKCFDVCGVHIQLCDTRPL